MSFDSTDILKAPAGDLQDVSLSAGAGDIQRDCFIFDLDGTLVDSLGDITASVNYVMGLYGKPKRTREDIRRIIGHGIRNLVKNSFPEPPEDTELDLAVEKYREHYADNCMNVTVKYEGIDQLLKALKERGCRLGIVSNKNDDATQKICKHYFGDTFEYCTGQRADIARKPEPDMVFEAIDRLGSDKDRAVYIGDSEVDIRTSEKAGIPCISCTWGFRDEDYLVEQGAKHLVRNPLEILDFNR